MEDARARLDALTRYGSDGVAVVEATTGRCLEANDRFGALVGRTAAELIGRPWSDLLGRGQCARLEALRIDLGASTHARRCWRVARADGAERLLEIDACVLGPGRWMLIAREAAGRAGLDWDLTLLHAIVDVVPLPLLVLDTAEKLYFNHRLEELLGMELSPERGPEQYRDRLVRQDGTPFAKDELPSIRILRGEDTVLADEYLVRRPDGAQLPVLGSFAPLLDERGGRHGVVGVFQDLTEHARREEAIRVNERLLDGIFELLPVGVWIADATGRIVRGNPAGVRIWSGARYVPPEEFGVYEAWWADTGEPVRTEDWALYRALTRGETSLGEVLRIRCFDGTFKTIVNSALPLRDERGRFAGAVVVNEDVSGLRAIEDALRRAIEERDRVLAFVSHDLRNLVAAVSLAGHVLSLGVGARPEAAWAADPVERIVRTARMMSRLIADLLDVVSIEGGSLSVVRADLASSDLVEEVVKLHASSAAEAGVDLVVAPPRDVSTCSADRDRILQVLSNLVGNAIKFTPRGGRVEVAVRQRDGETTFTVTDSGPGVPEGVRAHLFEPFWQADATDRRGLGLGLAIAKGIVDAHGGRIWVDSPPEQGAAFSFTVPDARVEG